MPKPPDMEMYEYIHGIVRAAVPACAAIAYQTEGPLPDAFAVYYLVAGNPQAFFSGAARRENERYSVAYYDRDKRNLEPVARQIKTAMQAGGFLYVTRSVDRLMSDTGHWARTLDFRYYQESEG